MRSHTSEMPVINQSLHCHPVRTWKRFLLIVGNVLYWDSSGQEERQDYVVNDSSHMWQLQIAIISTSHAAGAFQWITTTIQKTKRLLYLFELLYATCRDISCRNISKGCKHAGTYILWHNQSKYKGSYSIGLSSIFLAESILLLYRTERCWQEIYRTHASETMFVKNLIRPADRICSKWIFFRWIDLADLQPCKSLLTATASPSSHPRCVSKLEVEQSYF